MCERTAYCLFALFSVLILSLSGGPSCAADEYVLGQGDVLKIYAWDDTNSDLLIVNPIFPGLTTAIEDPHTITVSRDGRIYIPMIGTINVTGMKLNELEAILLKGLRRFTKNPQVSVLIKEPKRIKVSIAGEVARPGLYEIPDGRAEERTILNYLKLAGGVTPQANLEELSVVRRHGSGEAQAIKVNLRKMVSAADISQNVILEDGDTIIIPQCMNKVFVLGQVANPGAQNYIDGATVADYVGMAGGLLKFAASDNVGIIRGDVSNPVIKKVKLNKIFNFEMGGEPSFALRSGDIIFVPQSWYFDWADIGAVIVGFRDTRDAVRDLASPKEWQIDQGEIK
jgi:polysaccharide export outer membrane protein